MTTNFPLRFAALALCAAVLTGTLAACRGNANNQTTTGTSAVTTTSATNTTSDAVIPGTGTSSSTGGSMTGSGMTGSGSGMTGSGSGVAGSGSGVAGSGSGVAGSVLDGTSGEIDLAKATVRFNSANYHVSKEEQLRRDEIGKQLLIVQNTVDTPEHDGDAVALPEGTRVYAIKDNTDYSAVAVEIDGMFYRAGKQAD